MRVHKFGVTPGSKVLVVPLLFVKEFVTVGGIYSTEVAANVSEHEDLKVGCWFELEPVQINVDFIAEDNQSPDPSNGFGDAVRPEWDPESFVFYEYFLTFESQVLVVSLSDQVGGWNGNKHQPESKAHISCVHIQNVARNQEKG